MISFKQYILNERSNQIPNALAKVRSVIDEVIKARGKFRTYGDLYKGLQATFAEELGSDMFFAGSYNKTSVVFSLKSPERIIKIIPANSAETDTTVKYLLEDKDILQDNPYYPKSYSHELYEGIHIFVMEYLLISELALMEQTEDNRKAEAFLTENFGSSRDMIENNFRNYINEYAHNLKQDKLYREVPPYMWVRDIEGNIVKNNAINFHLNIIKDTPYLQHFFDILRYLHEGYTFHDLDIHANNIGFRSAHEPVLFDPVYR